MLSYKLDGDILEVKETIHGFNNSKVTYFYYDIKNWKKSSTGKKDSKPDRDMIQADIDWVKKYYIPKVKGSE